MRWEGSAQRTVRRRGYLYGSVAAGDINRIRAVAVGDNPFFCSPVYKHRQLETEDEKSEGDRPRLE